MSKKPNAYNIIWTIISLFLLVLVIPVIITMLPALSWLWAFMTYSPIFFFAGVLCILGVIGTIVVLIDACIG